jgi:hypothetical protein
MGTPHIKMISISNVFSRMMHFANKGDIEIGHCHAYDHATLVSFGSVLYEVLDGKGGGVVSSKEVIAPNFVFVDKNKYHRITALEPNTVCACIHALRDIGGDIIDPDCILETFDGDADQVKELVFNKTGEHVKNFCVL